MDDLVQWLTACLDAEEAEVRLTADAFGAVWTTNDAMESVGSDTGADVVSEPYAPRSFIAEHDPARVLREIDAKRSIIRAHAKWCQGDCEAKYPDGGFDAAHYWSLKALAAVYADRPGYREEWAP